MVSGKGTARSGDFNEDISSLDNYLCYVLPGGAPIQGFQRHLRQMIMLSHGSSNRLVARYRDLNELFLGRDCVVIGVSKGNRSRDSNYASHGNVDK
ncbi:MAG TPA: hypothetical protein VFV38_24595 [Ktedonobacteraceae bacterium]|nr:hypothetical protein [Ktedonobacteraceae bacterium]